MGAHTIPTKSAQLAGLNIEILDVTGTDPGMTPTITFTLTENDGTPVDPAELDSARFRISGPTTEYEQSFNENVTGAMSSGGAWVFTSSTPIPADAMGTWAFTGDFYRFVTIDDGGDGIEVREAAFNPLYYAAVTDAQPVARREIVDLDKCNVCHDMLALHGGQRFRIEDCVACHRPDATDEEVRPEEDNPPQSIHFKWMIHRIHTGKELTSDFTVYGFRSSVHNYNDVGFPGDRRTCVTCHFEGTYSVPVVEGALPTLTERDYYSPMLPAAAACLSCHSTLDAASHAYVNTAPFGESCAACHGDNREFSVDQVHAH
jgi:OmcA/MtrC family decaheme c-type cytochrome